MTRRLPFIDAVKGIACLVIVVHHLAVYGPMSEVIGAVYPQLIDTLVVYGRLAVQVFFVVAGYFVASQFAPHGVTTLIHPGPLVWKRYKRLITPFLFAVTLAALITALALIGMGMAPAQASVPGNLANIRTAYTGDVINGKKVVRSLNTNDLEPGKKHLLYFQGVQMSTGQ
jgi:peptidoglycan/LPS O-acetylase OafA/YrhL